VQVLSDLLLLNNLGLEVLTAAVLLRPAAAAAAAAAGLQEQMFGSMV
jgi:hypothetical protein